MALKKPITSHKILHVFITGSYTTQRPLSGAKWNQSTTSNSVILRSIRLSSSRFSKLSSCFRFVEQNLVKKFSSRHLSNMNRLTVSLPACCLASVSSCCVLPSAPPLSPSHPSSPLLPHFHSFNSCDVGSVIQ